MNPFTTTLKPPVAPRRQPPMDPTRLPAQKLRKKASLLAVLLLVVGGLSLYLNFNFLLLFTQWHYVGNLLQEMVPPNFSLLLEEGKVLTSIGETIAMAFLGTVTGGSIAMLLAFLAAYNTTPNFFFRLLVRGMLALERVTPNLVVILVLVISVGIGPFAGMLSLAIGSTGMFGKLFSDAIEHTDNEPVDAIYAVGANRLQAIRFAILPQVLPSFIANMFYAFDINLRAAIGLGIFGGGGIGYEIHMAMDLLRYKDALALICFTIVLISFFEKISDYLRGRVMGREVLK
jgi:phosphonate transport system permease protein